MVKRNGAEPEELGQCNKHVVITLQIGKCSLKKLITEQNLDTWH